MDNITKISLTIELEGSTLVRKSEPEVIKCTVTERDLNPSKKWRGKDGLKIVRKRKSKHFSLEAKPASLHVNMGLDAYNYMISSECPYWAKPKVWSAMTEEQRLEAHLQRTCEHHRGKSFTYIVLED